MVNKNDPFKYKIDARVVHVKHGEGRIHCQHADFSGKDAVRTYWVTFANAHVETDCREKDLLPLDN